MEEIILMTKCGCSRRRNIKPGCNSITVPILEPFDSASHKVRRFRYRGHLMYGIRVFDGGVRDGVSDL